MYLRLQWGRDFRCYVIIRADRGECRVVGAMPGGDRLTTPSPPSPPLQDIPRSSDRAPSRTFYTWRANYEGAGGQLAGELYAAASRVWARIRHEMGREREVGGVE